MKMRMLTGLLCACLIVSFFTGAAAGADTPVTGIRTAGKTAIKVGETTKWTATTVPADATNKSLYWWAGNPGVAMVDQDGTITAYRAGQSHISVMTPNGVRKVIMLTVDDIPVTGIITAGKTVLDPGETTRWVAAVEPADATNKSLYWWAGNPGVATVDQNGNITAHKSGKCHISITAANGVRKIVTVTVAPNAAELESRVQQFMKKNRLNEKNFAVSYYNPSTGESYNFNETRMMVAASTYKFPLNLYFYEMEQAGQIASDAYIPRAGTRLNNCHRMSLVDSNNVVSHGLIYYLGNFRTYKQKMRKYFTMTDKEIAGIYWQNNYYCTRMMMDALKYFYARQDQFPEMLGYMKQACPGHYFKKYLNCEIAHKYGSFEGAENDVGIIYGDTPFLLAVYTMRAGESVSANAAVLFKEYTDEQAAARRGAVREMTRLPKS